MLFIHQLMKRPHHLSLELPSSQFFPVFNLLTALILLKWIFLIMTDDIVQIKAKFPLLSGPAFATIPIFVVLCYYQLEPQLPAISPAQHNGFCPLIQQCLFVMVIHFAIPWQPSPSLEAHDGFSVRGLSWCISSPCICWTMQT